MNLIKKITASAALVALVSGFFTTSVSAADNAAIEAANKLAKAGIVVDHSNDSAAYELSRNVLRQEIAAVSRGIAGVEKASSYQGLFSDVTKTTPNTWAWQTVEALAGKGLIAKNNKFRPEDNITKSEGIGMVVKACYGNEYSYDSSKTGSWQDQVVAFASSKGMVAKFSDYNSLATRGFVFKAAANCLQEDVVDDDNIDNMLCQTLGLCDEKVSEKTDTTDGEKTETPKKENNVTLNKDALVVELSPETPENGDIAAGTARAKLLAFDVTAGNTDVTLKGADLKFTGLGDSKYLTDLAIYDGLQKVTKGSKKFQSDDTADLSFDRDIVIKAGETKTLFVTSTVEKEAANWNQTLQVTLTGLEASSTVEGDDKIVGATLQPIKVVNMGALELKSVNKVSGTINVGEVATLARFTLDETSDKESVTVKSISMQLDGSFDSDDLGDLALYADGKKIDADFEVNSSELEIELDQTVAQDKNVKFELKGSVSGSVNDDLQILFEDDAIYAIGVESGVSIDVDTTNDGENKELASIEIDGSEVNIAFNRSNKDEAKPGADDVELATVDLSSSSDYTISELTITVENTSSTNSSKIEDIIKTLELDGTTYDEVKGEDTTKAVYTFEDIDISTEEDKLPLVADIINETKINGADLEFTMDIVKVKDEDNNKTYTDNSEPRLSSILSNNSFTSKTLEIKSASLEIASTEVNDTEVVLGNGIKVVLYKGKISIGDADDIVLSDLNLKKSSDYSSSVDVDEVISDATLNIGGKTFKGDIEKDGIEFNSINATIAAGADNVEMLVVATLKDNDSISNGSTIGFQIDEATVEADDSEGDEVLAEEINVDNADNDLTKVILNDRGTFYVAATDNGDNKDDIKEVVLAGTNSVNLGEVVIQADMEDADVDALTFVVNGKAETAGTAAAGSLTATTSTKTTGSTTVTISEEISQIDVEQTPTKDGDITITVNGETATVSLVGGEGTEAVAEKIKVAVDALSKSTATHATNSEAVVITSTDKVNYDKITTSTGSTGVELKLRTVADGGVKTGPTAEVKTITFNRALVSGDKVSYNGVDYATISALANAISNQADVFSATVNGNVITVTGLNTGASVSLSSITTTAYAGSSAGTTTSVDFSSTFKNVKLMDESKVIADNATLTYVGGKTYITFKDFTLPATDSGIDAMLVADLAKYTTSGSETSAKLGKFTISPYNGSDSKYIDVTGKSSQEEYNTADSTLVLNGGTTEEVSIVPVTVTISIDNKFGNDDKYAKIKFTIDEGNNNVDDDDVNVSAIIMEDKATNLVVRNDNGDTIVEKATVNAGDSAVLKTGTDLSISTGDTYEFRLSDDEAEVRIKANGIEYTVDGNTYSITNDSVIDLGTYSKD